MFLLNKNALKFVQLKMVGKNVSYKRDVTLLFMTYLFTSLQVYIYFKINWYGDQISI